MITRLFITDLDNTLYNFIDYYAPSFRGMIHALSRELKIPENELIAQFKTVYALHGSLEYSFAVQELDCLKNEHVDEISRLIKIAKGAFSRVRQKNLVTYPNVKETLEWINNYNIPIVGVTNAPYFQAIRRLKQLNIEQFFTALVCWEGVKFEKNNFSREFLEKEESGKYATKIKRIWRLSKDKLKPNLEGYILVLNELGIKKENCYILGDSISKDVNPAEAIGAHGIWARYGEKVLKKNLETILSISNWDEKKKETIYFAQHKEPNLIIDDFGDLKNILQPPQLTINF